MNTHHSKRKRLLLIAYYFPPLGLSGVQRVLKWAKYLPDAGWDVTVLTARPGAYFAHDESLLQDLAGRNVEIVRTRSIDPTRWTRSKKVAIPSERRRKLFSGLSQTIFQPDNKIGWYPFAVSAGKRLFEERPYDAIYSSAPPYTDHLVGAALARFTGAPLILEYRDDWIENPRHRYATSWHRQLAADMELSVFKAAAGIVTINDEIRGALEERASGWILASDIRVFPHGFDPEDFVMPFVNSEDVPAERYEQKTVEFVYSGVFYDAQTPDTFLLALASFIDRRPALMPEIRASFVGLVPEYVPSLVKRLGLESVVHFHGYLNHNEAVQKLIDADILWMTIGEAAGAETISTSKLFEYFGTGKPILGLVPEGTARNALRYYGAAELVHPDDISATSSAIERLYEEAAENRPRAGNAAFIEQFNRRTLATSLGTFLDDIYKKEKLSR